MVLMRTTLTLDEDVAVRLHAESKKTGRPFKTIVNETLRAGLALAATSRPRPPFVVEPWPMGLAPTYDFDKVHDALDAAEARVALR